jgi:nucleoid-associated protein YgaU
VDPLKADLPRANPPRTTNESQMHLVQKNDTLWGLAKKFYGDPQKLELIREANLDLRYGGELIAGKTIVIPPVR